MTTFRTTFLALLFLVLSGCSSFSSAPEAQIGTDAIGPYTVVARQLVGETELSPQAQEGARQSTTTSFKTPARTIELRKYAANKYGTWFIVTAGNNMVWWDGKLTVEWRDNSGKDHSRALTASLDRLWPGQTWQGNTGAITTSSPVRSACAKVSGTLKAISNGNSGHEENSTARYDACKIF